MTGKVLLLSIAPEFFEKIASGSKSVELRRRFPNVPLGTLIYLYVTLPIGAVQGRVTVAGIDRGSRSKIWSSHGRSAGISKARFYDYFDGCGEAIAIQLSNFAEVDTYSLHSLRDAIPGFTAPQSYRYISLEHQKLLIDKPQRS